uniref:Secreted protein n=1 Tax=Ascaris lumbricoides TaxID=6252 RepID=A0A9J2PI34_ASCLU
MLRAFYFLRIIVQQLNLKVLVVPRRSLVFAEEISFCQENKLLCEWRKTEKQPIRHCLAVCTEGPCLLRIREQLYVRESVKRMAQVTGATVRTGCVLYRQHFLDGNLSDCSRFLSIIAVWTLLFQPTFHFSYSAAAFSVIVV